jgi:hypothetical protein
MNDKAIEGELDDMQDEVENERRINERRQMRRDEYPPLSVDRLSKILSLTIKQDHINKVVTFLCYLSAYTEDSQFNISFNAPSSAGKSYIALEVASLFPKDDVIDRGYCSPTAFFHDRGQPMPEGNGYLVDLERKILVFLDQPHNLLLEHMRPLFSHDQKEIRIQITDKTQKLGLKTKNVILRGFPSVVFCTAGLKINEQEATRFLLLSPETTQEKIEQGVVEAIMKGADPEAYFGKLNNDPERKLLIQRIVAVKEEDIKSIIIPNWGAVARQFIAKYRPLKPRHQRDVKRLMSIAKSLALLNLWHREATGGLTGILVSDEDIEAAFRIWDGLAFSQELNLPPYVLRLFEEIVLPLWQEKLQGLRRNEIQQKHRQVYGRPIDTKSLGGDILPMLENAGLIYQERDPDDKRNKLIFPILPGDTTTPNPEN